MIRIVCKELDMYSAHMPEGSAGVACKTFDVEAPELEKWLGAKSEYVTRMIVGVEVLTKEVVDKPA